MVGLHATHIEATKTVEKILATIKNPEFLRHRDTPVVESLAQNMTITLMNLKVQGIKNDWRYKTPEHFILEHGYYAKGYRKLPNGFKMMEPKQCFGNSQEVALALFESSVVYVEGVVTSVIGAIKHGWVRNDKHPVIDVTLRPLSKPNKDLAKKLFEAGKVKSIEAGMKPLGTPEDDANREYFGVPLSTDYVRQSVIDQEIHTCLIDNWERGWPLLNADDEMLKRVLVR